MHSKWAFLRVSQHTHLKLEGKCSHKLPEIEKIQHLVTPFDQGMLYICTPNVNSCHLPHPLSPPPAKKES